MIKRLERGVYRILIGFKELLSFKIRRISSRVKDTQGESEGTRVPTISMGKNILKGRSSQGQRSSQGDLLGLILDVLDVVSRISLSGLRVDGEMYFDNVRGYTVGGGYVHGDRGRVLESRDLVRFERISYCEVLCRVYDVVMPGQLVLYTNPRIDGEAVRVEWRPPKGFVKKNGIDAVLRMYWEVILLSIKVLVKLILSIAPWDVVRRFISFLSSIGLGKILVTLGRV